MATVLVLVLQSVQLKSFTSLESDYCPANLERARMIHIYQVPAGLDAWKVTVQDVLEVVPWLDLMCRIEPFETESKSIPLL